MPNLVPYEGRVVEPDESDALRRRITLLEEQLESSRMEMHRAKEQSRNAIRAMDNLQIQLRPMFNAMKAIFGEFDALGTSGISGNSPDARVAAVWQSWIQKLSGKRADFIQALLEHGEMTAAQLRVATHTANGSVAGIIHELKKLGLINKNGGKFSLKQL